MACTPSLQKKNNTKRKEKKRKEKKRKEKKRKEKKRKEEKRREEKRREEKRRKNVSICCVVKWSVWCDVRTSVSDLQVWDRSDTRHTVFTEHLPAMVAMSLQNQYSKRSITPILEKY